MNAGRNSASIQINLCYPLDITNNCESKGDITMKNAINEKAAILCQGMKTATSPSEAWRLGDLYFHVAETESYKELNKAQLSAFLHSAVIIQKETGYICLYEDSTMPGDARVDIIYKPSYAVSAIAIYAYLNYPEIFDVPLNRFFQRLLEGAFKHGIIGHGIECEETIRRTILMLCKAGVRAFLTRNHKEHLAFAHTIHSHMTDFEELSERIDSEHIIVTANGFSTDSINHLIKEVVAHWNGYDRPVFVYGTLMKGERANHLLSNCEFGGRCLLRNYAMYDLGSYPGIRPCSGESVLGELYFANDNVVARLDEYEGEGSLYCRMPVQIFKGGSSFAVEAYVYNQSVAGCKLVREAWNADNDDYVWYAGYGSNLSTNRFSCYISGGVCTENGRTYAGSKDPTPARAIQKCCYPGALYFGNRSSSWDGCGVAFFDPTPKNKGESVYMKCYLITRQQLHDVMEQEGPSPNWYGRLVCLDLDNHGIPVYTLTSETRRPENSPASTYIELIINVLESDFRLKRAQARSYINNWMRKD